MITINELTKTYGSHRVVSNLSFTAASGNVTGFLGPNGAGKSTTLRILCGLAPAGSGTAIIDGRDYSALPIPGREVGVMLDATSLHPGRTGRETLTLAALAVGKKADAVIPMLELVGLTGAARKRVGAYSLGMRQRLGLAGALIGEPHTLVLDEPVNGLDPQGIHWMRELLRQFADNGGTVLLSSHLLSEVQHIADSIVVVQHGELVTSGSTRELLNTDDQFMVAATDMTALRSALSADAISFTEESDEPHALRVEAKAERIGAMALSHRLTLTRIEPVTANLEAAFLTMTHAA